jgi:hypothetical protein
MSSIANKVLLQATASKSVRSIILNQLAAFRTPYQSISDNYRPYISCGPPIKSEIDDNKKFFRIFLEQKISCQVRVDELQFRPFCQGFFGLHYSRRWVQVRQHCLVNSWDIIYLLAPSNLVRLGPPARTADNRRVFHAHQLCEVCMERLTDLQNFLVTSYLYSS